MEYETNKYNQERGVRKLGVVASAIAGLALTVGGCGKWNSLSLLIGSIGRPQPSMSLKYTPEELRFLNSPEEIRKRQAARQAATRPVEVHPWFGTLDFRNLNDGKWNFFEKCGP